MPFAKRQLSWSEEVFAGVIILVLIIALMVTWFGFIHPLPLGYMQTHHQQAGVYYSEEVQQWVVEQD
jgi:hypothetical protein